MGGFLLARAQRICPSVLISLSSPQRPLSSVCAENSREGQAEGVPEQFTGLLHGSSPVFDCREEPFRLPGVGPASQSQSESRRATKAKEEAAAAAASTPPPPPSRPSMAAILTDCDPKAIYATVNKEPRDLGAGRMRPPGDLKLARSLSKSDSDLLVSPPSEEEGGLGNRSESVSNCSTGKKRLEKSPSFTSEWDEVGPRPGPVQCCYHDSQNAGMWESDCNYGNVRKILHLLLFESFGFLPCSQSCHCFSHGTLDHNYGISRVKQTRSETDHLVWAFPSNGPHSAVTGLLVSRDFRDRNFRMA